MMAISISLNAHNFSIVQPFLMILVSKFMAYKALSDNIRVAVPFKGCLLVRVLTNISLVSFLWGICKPCGPRSDV